MKRIGKAVLATENQPSILSYASIVGKKESQGAFGLML